MLFADMKTVFYHPKCRFNAIPMMYALCMFVCVCVCEYVYLCVVFLKRLEVVLVSNRLNWNIAIFCVFVIVLVVRRGTTIALIIIVNTSN